VSHLARVADDAFGRLLLDHLRANDVGVRDVVAAREPTTLAVATVAEDGGATYDFYVDGTADWQWADAELPDPLPPDVTALHVGSLAVVLPPGAERVEAMLRREHERGAVTTSLDPNIRPALAGDHAVAVRRTERQVGLAHLVKASSEDLAWLYPDEEPAAVADRWLELGPALVVVTLGAAGAIARGRGAGAVSVAARPVELVDTVGAGDAFTAGLLAGLQQIGALGGAAPFPLAALQADRLHSVLQRAALVASLTCARSGADPPTAAELTDSHMRGKSDDLGASHTVAGRSAIRGSAVPKTPDSTQESASQS
jgi:fructokinase